jgi:hypothetical protein
VTPEIEQLYAEIGKSALSEAPTVRGRLLLYGEVEDGVVSADLFFVEDPNAPVRFRFGSLELQDLLVSLWEKWQAVPGNKEWRTISYVIDEGKFHLKLKYPDQLVEEEDVSDRRPRVVQEYFGDKPVDYSKPR